MNSNLYGLNIWGNSNFIIEDGEVCLNTDFKPSLIDKIGRASCRERV